MSTPNPPTPSALFGLIIFLASCGIASVSRAATVVTDYSGIVHPTISLTFTAPTPDIFFQGAPLPSAV
ncbi:MAG: hypothetical protein NWT08_13515 [Akkermansiaceae bacterium]|jgi:hypothetical protein|nr:hypothetical protein [Akkermansiaceae bacterium]MDP4647630.1 hypothetical protein [Akkermansiaceae bacterium]MDP4722312.1 hypothetical protein [Akkermansiaceae bacterium]MDP4780352.1 hypothetical protein [Akkermansiaceae bacterium]MDP4846165.1 hypothetical protein [Akkermansiaceae bacterium]